MKKYLWAIQNWISIQYDDYRLFRAIKKQAESRIVIGAGQTEFDGFVSADYPWLDICRRESFDKSLSLYSVDVFVAEHVWEHLTLEKGTQACRNCFAFLKQNGTLRIAVPDGFHPDANYIAQVKPAGIGAGAEDHKVLYNVRTLTDLLEKTGF